MQDTWVNCKRIEYAVPNHATAITIGNPQQAVLQEMKKSKDILVTRRIVPPVKKHTSVR